MRKSALYFGTVAAVGAFVALPGASAQSPQVPAGTYYVRDALGAMGGGDVGQVEAPGELLPPFTAVPSSAFAVAPSDQPPYTFFPHAGTQGADLFTSFHVDLNRSAASDITQGGLDFECTGYAYQGHSGHDSVVEGFGEQAIGVPVFAALDGTVTAAHDGEPDQETTNLVGRPSNFVVLSHQGGYETLYYHFKRLSVRVVAGQPVLAGTELGLTGSSGNSSWPHLHFTSRLNGAVFEPSAGPCRPGSSYWSHQPPIRRDAFVTSFTYGTAEFTGTAGYPFDDVTRRGSYVAGTRTIYFRFGYRNRPANSSYRLVLTRPDGSTAMDNSGNFNVAAVRHAWAWFSRNVTLNTTGEWSLAVFINNEVVATAPFLVSDGPVANRAPLAVPSVTLEPADASDSAVTICRVTPETIYRRDPDYDLVRYRYRWLLRGVAVRDVTIASLSDALPGNLASPRSDLRCEVTPSDGALNATTAVAAIGVAP